MAELTGDEGAAVFYQVNVANQKEVDDAVKKIVDSWGKVDIVVNNAASRATSADAHERRGLDQVMAIMSSHATMSLMRLSADDEGA